MCLAEPQGQEDLHFLAEQFLAGVAEQSFGLRIYECDETFGAHQNDGVGSGLEKCAELLLGLLAAGKVADKGGEVQGLIAAHGGNRDFRRELAAIAAQNGSLEPPVLWAAGGENKQLLDVLLVRYTVSNRDNRFGQ